MSTDKRVRVDAVVNDMACSIDTHNYGTGLIKLEAAIYVLLAEAREEGRQQGLEQAANLTRTNNPGSRLPNTILALAPTHQIQTQVAELRLEVRQLREELERKEKNTREWEEMYHREHDMATTSEARVKELEGARDDALAEARHQQLRAEQVEYTRNGLAVALKRVEAKLANERQRGVQQGLERALAALAKLEKEEEDPEAPVHPQRKAGWYVAVAAMRERLKDLVRDKQ